MSEGRLIVACDFGTTTFRALVTETRADGQLEIVGFSRQAAAGFQDGDFTDLSAGSAAVARTIQALENESDIYVSGFTYNVCGSHLRSVRSTAQVPIGPGPRPIRESDIEEARGRVRSLAIPFDHKILSVTPVEYVVDRVRGIVDPLGRVGSHLEMHAHLITGSRSVLHNLENAVQNAKYKPLGEEVDVLAAGMGLVTPREQDEGVMLIDVGGTMTNWIVYARGAVQANGSVPLGGHHLTQDLAHGLRISPQEAEQVKRERGIVLRSLVDEVPVHVLFEEERPQETPGLVAAILEPRMEEILAFVKRDYGDLGQLAKLTTGVVLTGGGSRCRGTARLCEEVFDLAAQKRYLPAGLLGGEKLPQDQWATVVGLSRWAAQDSMDGPPQDRELARPGFLGRLRGMIKPRKESMSAQA